MFTSDEFDRIQKEFKVRQISRKQKLIKIWGFFLSIIIIAIVSLIVIFPKQFSNGDTVWILPTYGGILLLGTLTGFLISLKYVSEKPFFEYLYDVIIDKINQHEGLFLKYTPYDKTSRDFNKTGGLFTPYANVNVKRHIEGMTSDQHEFHIYDTMLTTSTNNGQQTHFDGIYFVLNKSTHTIVQVRTNGKPRVKGHKYVKVDTQSELNVFKEVDHNISSLDYKYLNFIEKLSQNLDIKRVYFSSVEHQLHLALWYKNHPGRKLKNISYETLNKLTEYFLSEFKLMEDLLEIDE
ncbi:hypothetical protein [Mariniplasma anaerobium]|uniref:DUF3137 domain-containing protein n=1 Tax=Mariniplasma anaerobium TaxID=2735436 RepID=A0A7U9XWB8_9MOLU|nr:hypothetical protein [Mariniplasma anaerobium]BCR35461.1 hypothetical protein MPAN_003540 [Mariniplasma anaerobium]